MAKRNMSPENLMSPEMSLIKSVDEGVELQQPIDMF